MIRSLSMSVQMKFVFGVQLSKLLKVLRTRGRFIKTASSSSEAVKKYLNRRISPGIFTMLVWLANCSSGGTCTSQDYTKNLDHEERLERISFERRIDTIFSAFTLAFERLCKLQQLFSLRATCLETSFLVQRMAGFLSSLT